jgi:hypothetical protein
MQPISDLPREKARIQARHAPYCLRWAEMYRTHEAGSPADCTESPTRAYRYLARLAQRYESCQVRQARNILRLYLYYSHSTGIRRGSFSGSAPLLFPPRDQPQAA